MAAVTADSIVLKNETLIENGDVRPSTSTSAMLVKIRE